MLLREVEALWVELFLQLHPKAPERIVLDLDATDDPLHGHQEGRFFYGYYTEYCRGSFIMRKVASGQWGPGLRGAPKVERIVLANPPKVAPGGDRGAGGQWFLPGGANGRV